MAIVTKTVLKAYFETGDFPTQSQFENFIDTVYPYEKYVVSITQNGSNDPSLLESENTLGATMGSSYVGTGDYKIISSTPVFGDGSKIQILTGANAIAANLLVYYSDASNIILRSYNTSWALADSKFSSYTIEIRVYP